MISIIILIILNIGLYKVLKIKKEEIEKDNIKYLKSKKHKNIKSYNIKPRMIIFSIVYIAIWLGISFAINKYLINNFEQSLKVGLLRYNVLSKEPLQPIEDMETETYVLGFKALDEDFVENRAYYYQLKDNEVSKSISSAIILNITEEKTNYETTGNLIYDKFLKSIFFQFYSYKFKQVYCQEEFVDFLEFNNKEVE